MFLPYQRVIIVHFIKLSAILEVPLDGYSFFLRVGNDGFEIFKVRTAYNVAARQHGLVHFQSKFLGRRTDEHLRNISANPHY